MIIRDVVKTGCHKRKIVYNPGIMKEHEAEFINLHNSTEKKLGKTVSHALTSTIGLLLLSPLMTEMNSKDSNDTAIYLQKGQNQGLYALERHMARVYHGFVLQFKLDDLDTHYVFTTAGPV